MKSFHADQWDLIADIYETSVEIIKKYDASLKIVLNQKANFGEMFLVVLKNLKEVTEMGLRTMGIAHNILMNTAIPPCPICGSNNISISEDASGYKITCNVCPIRMDDPCLFQLRYLWGNRVNDQTLALSSAELLVSTMNSVQQIARKYSLLHLLFKSCTSSIFEDEYPPELKDYFATFCAEIDILFEELDHMLGELKTVDVNEEESVDGSGN